MRCLPACLALLTADIIFHLGRSLESVLSAWQSKTVLGLLEFLVPSSVIFKLRIRFITGGAAGNEGLGALSFCFNWAYLGSEGSIGSLFTPLSTQLSLYAGTAVCM
jgi:hypothetical protein